MTINTLKSAAWIAAAATLGAPGVFVAGADSDQNLPSQNTEVPTLTDYSKSKDGILVVRGVRTYSVPSNELYKACVDKKSPEAALRFLTAAENIPNRTLVANIPIPGALTIANASNTEDAGEITAFMFNAHETAKCDDILVDRALLNKDATGYVVLSAIGILSFLAGLAIAMASCSRPCAQAPVVGQADPADPAQD